MSVRVSKGGERGVTGSIAHLNSKVPTAQPASKGVKLKKELAETIVTSKSNQSTVFDVLHTKKASRLTPSFLVNTFEHIVSSPSRTKYDETFFLLCTR